jgi:hypothetical protein
MRRFCRQAGPGAIECTRLFADPPTHVNRGRFEPSRSERVSLPPVSLALPAQPFHASINLNVAGVAKATGVSGQRLAVTTITVSNFNGTTQQLFLFNPLMDSGSCGGNVVGGASPQVTVLLEPFKTLQLQFPTPRIFEFGGLGCLAAEVTTVMAGGSVLVDVIGYAAP